MQPLHSTELKTRRGKLRNLKGIWFSRRVSACHIHTQLYGNHGQFVEAPIPDIEEASALSKHVSICHIHTQPCKNYGQFVEAPIADIEEASALSRRVSNCHIHTQPCKNYRRSIEDLL
ncbi:hypothetical protein ACFX11_046796 [Malus domestica]